MKTKGVTTKKLKETLKFAEKHKFVFYPQEIKQIKNALKKRGK